MSDRCRIDIILDMMVKKNLAYVDSQELDQLDIMTSDLDVPPHELQLQVLNKLVWMA